MFVERLTKDDVRELINSLNIKDYSITLIQRIDIYGFNRWSVDLLKNDEFRSRPSRATVVIEDFRTYGLWVDKKLFKAYMYKKFGEEYKQAFNDQLKRKYEEELIK